MAKIEVSGLRCPPHYSHEDAADTLRAMKPYGIGGEGIWRNRAPEQLAQMVFTRMPERLEGIAELLIRLGGFARVPDEGTVFLYDALQAEARAMRLAVAAVRDDDEGFVKPPPAPKRRRAGK